MTTHQSYSGYFWVEWVGLGSRKGFYFNCIVWPFLQQKYTHVFHAQLKILFKSSKNKLVSLSDTQRKAGAYCLTPVWSCCPQTCPSQRMSFRVSLRNIGQTTSSKSDSFGLAGTKFFMPMKNPKDVAHHRSWWSRERSWASRETEWKSKTAGKSKAQDVWLAFQYLNENNRCKYLEWYMQRLFLETNNSDHFWRGHQGGWKTELERCLIYRHFCAFGILKCCMLPNLK